MNSREKVVIVTALGVVLLVVACCTTKKTDALFNPTFTLHSVPATYFNSMVDCNMAEVWVGDTFRIFPGKYGEDPLWGYAHDLKFASGGNAQETFARTAAEFTEPAMPPNTSPGTPGLHGAVWFETVYQDVNDQSGNTLFAVYHNENYPQTLPFDSTTGQGYINKDWPQGLTGATTPAAVCRIGIMKSVDGGRSWENRGIFLEDLQPRMILKPHNTSITFAGGVGDPSAVASNGYLYLFYGEYGYPGDYKNETYDQALERQGQCISVARIKLSELDHPEGKAKRWDGQGFNASHDGIGKPIRALQIEVAEGGGAASDKASKFHWGPSVSWNTYLHAWVMLMARSEGPSWDGGNIYIAFNPHEDLGEGDNAQQWTTPALLVSRPGHKLWYPSLQPMSTPEDIAQRNTCLRLGKTARLFFKDNTPDSSVYVCEYHIEFK